MSLVLKLSQSVKEQPKVTFSSELGEGFCSHNDVSLSRRSVMAFHTSMLNLPAFWLALAGFDAVERRNVNFAERLAWIGWT